MQLISFKEIPEKTIKILWAKEINSTANKMLAFHAASSGSILGTSYDS